MIKQIMKEIRRIMYAIKPQKRYKGYYQVMHVLKICCINHKALDSLDKEVYPLVGIRLDCNPKSIEKNIRMFLDNIDYSKLSELLNMEITGPLEVKEFVYRVVAYIDNKYRLYME